MAEDRIKASAQLGAQSDMVAVDLGNSLANKDLAARESTLDKRERALAAKEEELKKMEKVPGGHRHRSLRSHS